MLTDLEHHYLNAFDTILTKYDDEALVFFKDPYGGSNNLIKIFHRLCNGKPSTYVRDAITIIRTMDINVLANGSATLNVDLETDTVSINQ